jgi:hypothetical protein
VDVALKAQEACRKEMGYALSCLLEIAQTAADPRVRREATAGLNSTMGRLLEQVLDLGRLVETAREAGLDVSRRSTEQPGDKPS